MRGNQVIRQWRLVRLLSATTRGRSLAFLQSELEVTSRTVRRDLAALAHWAAEHGSIADYPGVDHVTNAALLECLRGRRIR